MSAVTAPSGREKGGPVALRFALRELRGGLRGFYVFIACIALGVAAIAGVGSLAGSLGDGLSREGRTILGGDLSFGLIHRELEPAERDFLASRGRVSVAATMRAMARKDDGNAALVEIKAVDGAYPLYGAVKFEPAMPVADALAERNGRFGAAADETLLARLNIAPGAVLNVGDATVELRAALATEPDKFAGGIGFGPRLLISEAGLRATNLLQPGSLVRWHYRLQLPGEGAGSNADKRIADEARERFPQAGWEIRSRHNASPSLERNIERFTQFLTIVGLTALLVGGVGVGNAVHSHLEKKRESIATMKALGATGRRVFAIYLTQAMIVAAIGSAIGLVIGAALPYAVVGLFGTIIPLPIVAQLQPVELGLAMLYGLVTALAFALWPLGRAHDAPVGALFRDAVAPQAKLPRRIYLVATAVAVVSLAALAVLLAYDRKVAIIYVGCAAAAFLLLRLVATVLMDLARKAPRARSTALRMAVSNIYRPGALTPSIVLSLGLGLALLVTVIQIDGNLQRQFNAELPEKAPSFFFLDIPSGDSERFDAFINQIAPAAKLEEVPILRGRIIAGNNIPAEELKPKPDVAWVLQSDRGLSYTEEVPAGSRLVEGDWWGTNYSGPPIVSFEKRIADGLGLKLGDSVTVNVLGRNITARIANLRMVDWQSLGINFVMVFPPSVFRGAPHTRMATLTYPGGGTAAQEVEVIKAVSTNFPSVTTVRVKEALETIGGLVTNLVLGIRAASAVTLLAAAMVLGGALAAGHSHRVYDAVILKTLGATRGRLITAYMIEYGLLGAATALFGMACGSLAAWMIVTELMNLRFTWLPGPALAATLGALIVTVALGLIGTLRALGQKPAPVLRNL